MLEVICFAGGAAVGGAFVWMHAQAEIASVKAKLTRLTDRDEKGRFVRREP